MYALRPDLDPSNSSLLYLKNKSIKSQLEICDHSKQIISKFRKNCFSCGSHLSNDPEVRTYKTIGFSYKLLMDINGFCSALLGKKLLKEMFLKPTHPYSKNRLSIIEMIYKLSENLKLSQNTMQMAVAYMDYVVLKGYIPSGQYNIYATTAVMLAAKAVELDRRIPYISSLRKYAVQDFRPEEIKRTEEIMLEILDWNTQFATLVDIIEYFLSQGIVFSNDYVNFRAEVEIKETPLLLKLQKYESQNEKNQRFQSRVEKSKSMMETNEQSYAINKSFYSKQAIENDTKPNSEEKYKCVRELNDKQLEELVNKIEKEIKRLTNVLIKDASFLESNLKLFAAALVAFMRKSYGFKSFWNEELSLICNGIKESEIMEDLNKISSKLDQNCFASLENEQKTLSKRMKSNIFEKKDIFRKVNTTTTTTDHEKSFAPLNNSNLENQFNNSILLKNPVKVSKPKQAMSKPIFK